MPVTFRPEDVLELNRWGIFTKWRPPGMTIPAAQAITITAGETSSWTAPYTVIAPAINGVFPIQAGWGAIIERFNWGHTSKPDKVFYEIHNYGRLISPQEQEGYHCGGPVGYADEDNRSTHPAATEKLELKLWNISSPPEDVWIEFATWYYTFPLIHLDKILAMSFNSLFGVIGDRLDVIAAQLDAIGKKLKVPMPELPPIAIRPEEEAETRTAWEEITKLSRKLPTGLAPPPSITRRR